MDPRLSTAGLLAASLLFAACGGGSESPDGCVPATESCNGVDDDCDGEIDEAGAGGCGTWYRDDDADGVGGLSACLCASAAPFVLATGGDCDDADATVRPGAADLCDGVDDDCDPATPDGAAEPTLGAACDGPDADLCAEGTIACTGGLLACSDATGDALELCDGTDDDCDPATPDGADEATLGAACDGADSDLCAEGTIGCTGGVLACSDATAGTLDLCNGADDDCNPATPDGAAEPTIGAACDGPDADFCREGTRVCASGAMSCSDATGDNLDLCNGMDDDCNPATADGAGDPALGTPCDGPDGDLCQEGTWSCAGLSLSCSDLTATTIDVCNDLDDDCSGTIDQDFLPGGSVSLTDRNGTGPLFKGSTCGLGRCAGGAVTCDLNDPSALTCSTWVEMRPELCNGVDDDCDGQVDDSPRQPSCALTLGVCASKRPSTCGGASGWLACTASDYGATYEPTEATCGDGLDNDCDGQADAADADCAPWSHTVAIDGTNDFTAEEQFSTTSAGYTGWVTWDADDLFVGYEGADVASGTATKWLVVYLGATGGGTTAGEQFNHQRPILPFTATHLVMIRMDFGYFSLRDHDVSWVEATPAGAAVAHAGTFVEFRIPRASLGAPAALSVHLCMLNEQFPGEWTWGGVPSSSFVDRFDPDFLHYLQFDLTAQAAPGSSLPQ